MVQLYSSKFIDLNQLSILTTKDPQTSLVAPLTYQSLNLSSFSSSSSSSVDSYDRSSTSSAAVGSTNTTTGTSTSTGNVRLDPDFGIWNCHIVPKSNNNTPSKLLQACHPLDSSKKPLLAGESGTNSTVPVFVVVLDLDYENLALVHVMMETVLENIVEYCMTCNPCDLSKRNSGSSSSVGVGSGAGTTRLKILQSTQFGKAPLTKEEEDNDGEGDDEKEQEQGEKKEETWSGGGGQRNGLNVMVEEHVDHKVQVVPKEEVYMHLIICGVLGSKKDVTYREKQALNLVSYHLQKFASEVNCTLCFMNGDHVQEETGVAMVEGNEMTVPDKEEGGEGLDQGQGQGQGQGPLVREDGFRPKGLSVLEFVKCLANVVFASNGRSGGSSSMSYGGIRGSGDDDDDDGSDSGDKVKGLIQEDLNGNDIPLSKNSHWHQQPSFYGPFDYDVDLINSVLLRGAGCPGVWNANTDSLWVALPPSSSSCKSYSWSRLQNDSTGNNPTSKLSNHANSDQEWLEKLAESVNVYAGTTTSGGASDGKSVKSSMEQTVRTTRTSANNTVATKKKVVKKKPSAAGDNSQDVQDFFAGLLNK
jgi:hypothetical protein